MTELPTTLAVTTPAVLMEVLWERKAQNAKWGEQNHPDGTTELLSYAADEARESCQRAFSLGLGTWRHILEEEVAEAMAEEDKSKLKTELIQVAAVAVAWVEKLNREAAE